MSALYQNILVPLDGSELAGQALPYAEEIAEGTGAKVTLLQVVEDANRSSRLQASGGLSGAGVVLSTAASGSISALAEEISHIYAMDIAKRHVDEVAVRLQHRKICAEGDIDTGDPATRILHYAAANHVDLIVMSTHGRTGLSRWTYGSVANKVLQAAPCAVMVVRPRAH